MQEKPTPQHLRVNVLCAASSSKCSSHLHHQLTKFLAFSFVPNLVQQRQFERSKLLLDLQLFFPAALRLIKKTKNSLGS